MTPRTSRHRSSTQTAGRALALPCAATIAQHTLANGVRVLAYENFASPSVVVNGYLVAGARDESPDKAGLADFTTECMMRGSDRFTYEQIFELTESIGASLSVSAAMHTCSLYAKSLADDAPLLFDMMSDVVRHPTFPADEVERERNEWLSSLEERANSTRAMCGMAFSELCYPESHPYHWNSDGYPHTARAISRDDVERFHRTFFSPAGMVIAVVGAMRAEEALRHAERAFGDWRPARPGRAPFPEPPRIEGASRRHVTMPGKSQTSLMWGRPGPSRRDPDWIACTLMNSILGQFGMYGRLGESVRKDEGLVYSIGSRFEGGPVPGGSWHVSAGTNPSTVERVLDVSRAEVRRIQAKRVTPRELADNKSYFIGSLPLSLETNDGIAGQIVSMLRYDLGLDYMLEYPARVSAVSAADIQRVAQTWLDADNYVLATAGP